MTPVTPPAEEAALNATSVDATLAALAEPTRRAVVEMLRHGPLRAGELAQALAMSPPALSRHLRVLKASGLLADDEPEHDARVRLYRLQPEGFQTLGHWVDEVRGLWADQLAAFQAHVEQRARDAAPAPAAAPAPSSARAAKPAAATWSAPPTAPTTAPAARRTRR